MLNTTMYSENLIENSWWVQGKKYAQFVLKGVDYMNVVTMERNEETEKELLTLFKNVSIPK